MRFSYIISIITFLLLASSDSLGRPAGIVPDAHLSLYYGWQQREKRDSAYLKAYQKYQTDLNGGTSNVLSSPAVPRETVWEIEELRGAFSNVFWTEKDYDSAFYIAFQLEEKLQEVSESHYPDKRKVYYELGEAYYLFLDFHKSIELLSRALAPAPLSFEDTANLDALNILGICYANIGQMVLSDEYFRAVLLSRDIVRRRPLYNAYAISHLGCNEMMKGNYDRALELSGAVWPVLRKETKDYGHLAGMCYCRGRSYLQKGDFRQASAWIDSLAFFASHDTYNPIKRIKQVCSLQSNYYSLLGDARLTKVYADSLMGIYEREEKENTSGYIVRAAQKYTDEKIEVQQAALDVDRIRIMVISLVALLSIAAAVVISSLYRTKNAAYKALAQKASEWAQYPDVPSVAVNADVTAVPPPVEPLGDEEKRVISLIECEMTDKCSYREQGLTIEELADRMGVHRNLLSRVINRHMGGNFSQYVNSLRIKEAVRLISGTSHSELRMVELSDKVGFLNYATFYRTFKQFTGLSPIEFQKQRAHMERN